MRSVKIRNEEHRARSYSSLSYSYKFTKISHESRNFNPIESNSSDPLPELKLLVSILIRAIYDGFGHLPIAPEVARDARRWVRSFSKKPFSFFWVCEHLTLDPLVVRKTLLANISEKLHTHKAASTGLETLVTGMYGEYTPEEDAQNYLW